MLNFSPLGVAGGLETLDIYISGRRIDGKLMLGEADGEHATWSVRIPTIEGVSIDDLVELEVMIGADRYTGKARVSEAVRNELMLEGEGNLSKEA